MKASIIIFIVLITLKLYPQPISFNPVMLVADNHEGAAKIALILDALDQPYTMYTDSALQFITVREWRHFDAVLWIGLVTNAEEESCKAYLNGGGNLLVMDNDAAYDLSIGNIFLEGYLMAKYIRDSGSDTIIRGTDLMEGLQLDITADPYPDGVKPYSGFGTGVPILIGKTIVDPPYTTVICYAGIRGVGVNFRTTLLLWDPQYISDIEGMKCIINKTIQWLIGGAVPVELTAFNVTSKNGEVNLNWITASETNNKGFEIERSNEDEFEKVGFVSGNGTTTEQHEYYFKDEAPPGHYSYRLKQIDHNGFFDYSKIVEVEVKQPNVYSLNQNYPNPFNPNTTFSYSLANIGQVTIKVFNILGKEVQTLVNEFKPAGTYHMEWNAYNLPSGIYFYQMNSGSFIETKKMILLK